MTDQSKATTIMAEERTELGELRTLMGADRTLMAWVRTALSMLSFSFTIYKVLNDIGDSGGKLRYPNSPIVIGLVLAIGGVAAMLMGIIEYRVTVRLLRPYHDVSGTRSTVLIAYFMLGAGLLLVFGIATSLL